MDGVSHRANCHREDVADEQAVKSTPDAVDVDTGRDSAPNYRPDGGVHARRISAAGKNANLHATPLQYPSAA